MRCSKAQKRIALYAGGDTTYRESESVKEHLIGCDMCAADYRAYQGSRRALEMLRDRTMPEWFWEGFNRGVFRRIREDKAAAKAAPVPHRALFTRAATVFAAAAVVTLMFMFAWPFVRVERAPSPVDTPGLEQNYGAQPRGYAAPSAMPEEPDRFHQQEWFKPVDSSRSQEV